MERVSSLSRRLFAGAVRPSMMLAGFFGMMSCMMLMAGRDVGMMAGFFVIALCMVLRSGTMMLGGVFMVLRCLQMVIDHFFRHGDLSRLWTIHYVRPWLLPEDNSLLSRPDHSRVKLPWQVLQRG
jgi:hypothetical protein